MSWLRWPSHKSDLWMNKVENTSKFPIRGGGDLSQPQPALLIVLFLFGCDVDRDHNQTVGLLKVRTKVNTVYYLHTADAETGDLPNYCVSFHSNRKNGGRKVLGVLVRKEKCNMRCPLDGGSRQIWRLLEFLKINLWKIKIGDWHLLRKLKTSSNAAKCSSKLSLYRQFCFEHKFYLCSSEKVLKYFQPQKNFTSRKKTLFSFPISSKVTIMVIRDIKSKNKIVTNCSNAL